MLQKVKVNRKEDLELGLAISFERNAKGFICKLANLSKRDLNSSELMIKNECMGTPREPAAED